MPITAQYATALLRSSQCVVDDNGILPLVTLSDGRQAIIVPWVATCRQRDLLFIKFKMKYYVLCGVN